MAAGKIGWVVNQAWVDPAKGRRMRVFGLLRLLIRLVVTIVPIKPALHGASKSKPLV